MVDRKKKKNLFRSHNLLKRPTGGAVCPLNLKVHLWKEDTLER
jgi:hypothetical protein